MIEIYNDRDWFWIQIPGQKVRIQAYIHGLSRSMLDYEHIWQLHSSVFNLFERMLYDDMKHKLSRSRNTNHSMGNPWHQKMGNPIIFQKNIAENYLRLLMLQFPNIWKDKRKEKLARHLQNQDWKENKSYDKFLQRQILVTQRIAFWQENRDYTNRAPACLWETTVRIFFLVDGFLWQ